MKEDGRCSGHCCKEFVIGTEETLEGILTFVRERAWDGEQIADMLVPLRLIDVGTVLPSGNPATRKGGGIFTCRHYDADTNDCRIYDSRPRMCRDYPYGTTCASSDCTWRAGRDGAWPPYYRGDELHLRVVQANGEPDQRQRLEVVRLRAVYGVGVSDAGDTSRAE